MLQLLGQDSGFVGILKQATDVFLVTAYHLWYMLKIFVLSFPKQILWKASWKRLLKLLSIYVQILWLITSLWNHWKKQTMNLMILCLLPVLIGWTTKGFTKFHCAVNCNSGFSQNKRNACQIFTNQKNGNVIYVFAYEQDKFEAPRKGKAYLWFS